MYVLNVEERERSGRKIGNRENRKWRKDYMSLGNYWRESECVYIGRNTACNGVILGKSILTYACKGAYIIKDLKPLVKASTLPLLTAFWSMRCLTEIVNQTTISQLQGYFLWAFNFKHLIPRSKLIWIDKKTYFSK